MQNDSFNDIIDQVISHGVNKGILHLYSENKSIECTNITVNGKAVINFGSCSYLGLEHDRRLKDGAQSAVERFGTQFSSSRAYLSLSLYKELENLFGEIFSANCIVTPTTTLGHLANLPVLVGDKDAIIIDQQVHSSVQMALSLLKVKGVYTEIVRHNRTDLLEERITRLHSKFKKIWYMADGVYSMFGDDCDVENLYYLMNKYEKFHCYIDDAHGMSIYGSNGEGYVLNNRKIHPKMNVATSLAKAFATGGAVMIYSNKEMARRVRTCGGPLITSGPLQPANLGAAIACAKIHLTSEIQLLQKELYSKIEFANGLLEKFGLPIISKGKAPIFFVGVSLPKLGYNLVKRLMDKGYYVNLGIFPAVPMKNTGIRFTITRLHTNEQIYDMIKTLASEFPKALLEEGMEVAQIYKAFKKPFTEKFFIAQPAYLNANYASLRLSHYKTIRDVEVNQWNKLFESKGTFDWNGMLLLEKSFTENDAPENNWSFDYIIIRDDSEKVIVATFITTTLWKDDMLSPAKVSETVEELRADQPYYLTSIVTSTGSPLSEGEHLFINKNSAQWKNALLLLIEKMHELQVKYKANNLVIRDFHCQDDELTSFFIDNDFVKIQMPDTNIIEAVTFNTIESFYEGLSKRSQQHFREDVRKHINKFDVSIISNPSQEDLDKWYKLYLNIKNNSLELNTFILPEKLFIQLAENKNWETIVLKLKPDYHCAYDEAVCVVWCYRTADVYIPMIIGIDYAFNRIYKVYRQALFQIVMRAVELNKQKIFLGLAASVEKKKLGAVQIATYGFMQYKDGYNLEILAGLTSIKH